MFKAHSLIYGEIESQRQTINVAIKIFKNTESYEQEVRIRRILEAKHVATASTTKNIVMVDCRRYRSGLQVRTHMSR